MIRILLRGIIKISILPFLAIVFLVLGNIYTYQRLIAEEPIAKLRFSFINQHEYDATLTLGNNCDEKIYRIYGDEWRLDVQFLKWKSWATLFGIDAMYRIERLSGRYSNINDENIKQHIAHEIKPVSTLDLSKVANYYDSKFPPVDTVYGSSAYEKMNPDTIYTVFRTQAGVLIREEEAMKGKPIQKCATPTSQWKKTITRLDQQLASLFY